MTIDLDDLEDRAKHQLEGPCTGMAREVLELVAGLRKAQAELKRCFRERLWLAEYMSAYAGPDWRRSPYEYLALAKKCAKAVEECKE